MLVPLFDGIVALQYHYKTTSEGLYFAIEQTKEETEKASVNL